MIQIKELQPGQRKSGPITGSRRTDKKSTTPSPAMISDAIKKGRRAGNTECRKTSSPDRAAL